MALGAQKNNVLRMMMREVATLMLSGIAIAVPAYIAVARYIRSQLYGIEPNDLLNIAAVSVFLLAIGFISVTYPRDARFASITSGVCVTGEEGCHHKDTETQRGPDYSGPLCVSVSLCLCGEIPLNLRQIFHVWFGRITACMT
jgi:hypothetical protein